MSRKYILILVAAVGIQTWMCVLPLKVGAEEGRFAQYKQQRQEKMNKLYDELNVSEEQRIKIKEARGAMHAKKKELREAMKAKRAALKEELEKDEVDKVRIDAMVDELVGLTGRVIRERVDGILKVKQILTKEQFKIFVEKTKKFRKEQWKNRHKRFQESE